VHRRNFLKALPAASAAVAMPALAQVPALNGVRIKITDIRVVRLRVVKEIGKFEGFMGPNDLNVVRVGGGNYLEVRTDQGLVGIGSGIDPVQLPMLKSQLLGRDPFEVQTLVANLRGYTGFRTDRRPLPPAEPLPPNSGPPPTTGNATGAERASAAAEIALWDIIGKASNQPLYRLWGAVKDRVAAYASQARLGPIEARADLAAKLKSEGWRAIKFRAHFPTMKEDIRLVELTRKAVGDDFDIMCDANQATNGFLTPTVVWDFRRAVETARAYQALGVYFLEEPLPRYDYEHLAELNRLVELPIAGGEGNRGMREFRDLLERGCFDIIQPEILIDGPLALRKYAVLAEAMNKQVAPHIGDASIATVCNMHLIASWPNATYVEVYHDLPMNDYRNTFAMFEEPPVIDRSGYFNLSQKPGLGLSINKDFILTD
jgi:L-alanine-DL-glutamate epimerase-like enolase superfamily enzyme